MDPIFLYFPIGIRYVSPAKVAGQAGERHVIEAEDGERSQLAESSRQPRDRVAAKVCDLQRPQLLDILRDIGNVCKINNSLALCW